MTANRTTTLAALAALMLLPAVPALAQEGSVTLRGGVKALPDYFGSDSYRVAPTFGLRLDHFRLGGVEIGSPDAQPLDPGFRLRGSFRYIRERDSDDSPDLAGLPDVDASFEIGVGASYVQDNWRMFGDLRYGVIGHEGVVADLGGDVIWRPTEQLTLTLGPRAQYGNGQFTRTYFGVANPTPTFPTTYDPSGGLVSTGAEAGFVYRIDDRWSVEGAARYDMLRGDAGDSPIVERGSRDQFSVRLGIARQVRFGF